MKVRARVKVVSQKIYIKNRERAKFDRSFEQWCDYVFEEEMTNEN
jgi:hypothetical protein